ncbi:hypothetical protein [Actinomadura miaoliensis]|uniref:Uncharacterized protein n=1 Tax=Actinomadura miaoliensis TaxID=430685 RepID=A0ABP7V6F7_9ACTN
MGKRGTSGDSGDGYRPKDKQGTFEDPAKRESKGSRGKDDKDKGGKGK